MKHSAEQLDELYKIVELVNGSDISSIKNVVTSIVAIINDPRSTARDLRRVIQVDPPLTAKVLKLANSAFYAPRTKIEEIQQAVIRVGYDAIRELALSQKVCEVFRQDEKIEGYSRSELWRHSLAVAVCGTLLFRREFGERGENMYVAGLLHDIGLIALDQFRAEAFKEALQQSIRTGSPSSGCEDEILGFNHGAVGGFILSDWRLPPSLCEAISAHHQPDEAPKEARRMAHTLHVADQGCMVSGIGMSRDRVEDEACFQKSMEALALEPHALEMILEDVHREIARMEDQGFFE